MTRKIKNVEKETQTRFNQEYGKNHSETRKMRNAY
jgi:hypothetical protein